ncbi:MAG: nucleotidyl transferase AbiEii/AbiGii toxin family protein [Acidobacteria bacterium]|nr:nucleotidyl transferase AbiEii/AbiGii toxin family protein [Acidobacteriota bacterium]
MNFEPRREIDYQDRQVSAAHRVLMDIGQVLASFHDSIVVVGGWVPDLLIPGGEPQHIGSIDVDIALDARKLNDGRYAELLNALLGTGRYRIGAKPFQLVTSVHLDDQPPVIVDLEFLASAEVNLKKNKPKLVDDFRVLQFPACAVAFESPIDVEIHGRMISGAENSVRLLVSSLSDFIIMKAHAIGGRDKPKDVYDLCHCLAAYPEGIDALANDWQQRSSKLLVEQAVAILGAKFKTVAHYGPQQLAIFHGETGTEEAALHARRAYELVQKLLAML